MFDQNKNIKYMKNKFSRNRLLLYFLCEFSSQEAK